VSGSRDKTLKVWNAESGLCERTLQGHTNYVLCVSMFMGADGFPRIVSGSVDNTLKVWNAESGECERTLQGHTQSVRCVSVFMGSDGNPRIVSGSGDTTLKVWNAESGLCERTLLGYTHSVWCVSMFMGAYGNPRIVVGSGKGVKVLNLSYFDRLFELRRKVQELETIIEELQSRPGGPYYLKAEEDFKERQKGMI